MLALFLFLLLPGHPLSYIGGLPWRPLALGCAVLLGIGVFAAWPPSRARWVRPLTLAVLVLAGLKLALGLAAPRYGLEASYYSNDRFGNEPEGSTALRGVPYTRIDGRLDFGSDEFPLYFFNDTERFNTLGADRFDRGKTLTWSARWTGFLNVPDDRPVTIWLTASGPGDLSLDGKRLLKVDAEGRETAQAEPQLTAGSHPVEVRYARKKERSGFLKVETDLSGRREAVGSPTLTAAPYPPERLALDRWVTLAARAIDVAFLVLLGGGVAAAVVASVRRRLVVEPGMTLLLALERPLLALVPLGFFVHSARDRLDRYGKMAFLAGGQDWLTHETLARDIQFNGPLMTLGKPLGQGALYYAQPFYPYYLALLHTLSGEDLYGPLTLQVLGLGVATVLVYELARRLFGRPTALVTLALMVGVLVPFELAWVARLLISEALYYWVMPAAVLALIVVVTSVGATRWVPRAGGDARAAQSGRDGRGGPSGSPLLAVMAGLLLGIACLTRGPTLLYLPLAGVLVWLGLRRRGVQRREAARMLAVVGLCAGLLIALVPIRNQIVAGRPALTASSGGVNMEKLHRPSEQVRLRGVDENPLYNRLGLDRPTREVLEYVRQDPAGYFASYLPLAAYTLGVGSAINHLLEEQPVQLHPELLVLNALYLLALLVVARARSLEAGLLHSFIAVHFLTMLIFAPYDYENRLVTPMYLFVVIFAAAGLTGAWELGVRTLGLVTRSRTSGEHARSEVAARVGGPSPNPQLPTPNS